MAGSKLVDSLAESLVLELIDTGLLDLTNNEKFAEFTDLLYEILDKQYKAEERDKAREEKEKEDGEPLESVKELADKVNDYFKGDNKGVSADELSAKADKILEIVKKLQGGGITGEGEENEEESGDETDKDKKKKKMKLVLSGNKKKNESVEANAEKEAEKKEEEKQKMDKQTTLMLQKLTKNFEESEKRRKKENSIIRKGLRRVERKIGSLLWKALNKFKGILLIGALIFFREPILNFFKNIWSEYLEPYVKPLVSKLGEKVGKLWGEIINWFKRTFPKFNNWIEKDWPEIKKWIGNNWERIKEWFTETIPTLLDGLSEFLEKTWLGKKINKKIKKIKKESLYNQAAEQAEKNDPRWAETLLKADTLSLESAETDKKEWEEQGFLKRNMGLEDVLMFNPVTAPSVLLYKLYKNKKTSDEFNNDITRIKNDIEEDKRFIERNNGTPSSTPPKELPEENNPLGGGTGNSPADVIPDNNGVVVDNSSSSQNIDIKTFNIYTAPQTGDTTPSPTIQ